jgi:hypothetical protein
MNVNEQDSLPMVSFHIRLQMIRARVRVMKDEINRLDAELTDAFSQWTEIVKTKSGGSDQCQSK